MSPSNKTLSKSIEDTNISTEATKLPTSNSPCMTQYGFSTNTKKLNASFNDNNVKRDTKYKEIISKQDEKFER